VTALFLYDDARARAFEPFALTRPISELRAGALITRDRWERRLGVRARGTVAGAHLADFEELDAPGVIAEGELPAGAIVANARFLPSLEPASSEGEVWLAGGRVAAVRLTRTLGLARLADGETTLESLARSSAAGVELRGRWMDELWDFIRHLGAQLADDIAVLGPQLAGGDHEGREQLTVLGTHPVYLESGAVVEPFTVLDANDGPILLRAGSVVRSFTRVAGPCYVGEGSTVAGDRVGGCAIGETSRVHGEISASIVLGHANKSHDGFVGHSYLGRWVNLGAGTTTSNLKNTYGDVALWTPAGMRDTGMQFLGTFFGDHAKTGIGLRLTTGTVVGAGANIFDAMPPKCVPPFSWGGRAPYAAFALDKFLRVAEHVMQRRHLTLGEGARRQLAAAHAAAHAAHGTQREVTA
jgi:UDP-N-acetylglucosamine diphosphorylase/glucosamine-1-phosphate N-acetyltransferase